MLNDNLQLFRDIGGGSLHRQAHGVWQTAWPVTLADSFFVLQCAGSLPVAVAKASVRRPSRLGAVCNSVLLWSAVVWCGVLC
jgi:hypothetical protein